MAHETRKSTTPNKTHHQLQTLVPTIRHSSLDFYCPRVEGEQTSKGPAAARGEKWRNLPEPGRIRHRELVCELDRRCSTPGGHPPLAGEAPADNPPPLPSSRRCFSISSVGKRARSYAVANSGKTIRNKKENENVYCSCPVGHASQWLQTRVRRLAGGS
jgi:hypothetical protein